jgi:hypothetical protein
MMAVSSAQLLAAWERGLNQPPARRVLTLLNADDDGGTFEALARLSIGERDRRLLCLREQMFGPHLNAIAECPACGESLEVDFNIADVRVEPNEPTSEPFTLEHEGYVVAFRLPASLDLGSLDENAAAVENRRRLVELCVLSASRSGSVISADELPEELVAAIAAQMAKADPQAEILITMQCPACPHQWSTPLDIGAFFWAELNAWATRLLREILLLAAAYGWREPDILALSPTRRQLYLEMLER